MLHAVDVPDAGEDEREDVLTARQIHPDCKRSGLIGCHDAGVLAHEPQLEIFHAQIGLAARNKLGWLQPCV